MKIINTVLYVIEIIEKCLIVTVCKSILWKLKKVKFVIKIKQLNYNCHLFLNMGPEGIF